MLCFLIPRVPELVGLGGNSASGLGVNPHVRYREMDALVLDQGVVPSDSARSVVEGLAYGGFANSNGLKSLVAHVFVHRIDYCMEPLALGGSQIFLVDFHVFEKQLIAGTTPSCSHEVTFTTADDSIGVVVNYEKR